MWKKALWQTALGLAGIVYIVVVLGQNVQSPVLGAAFILAAGYEMIGSHKRRHKP